LLNAVGEVGSTDSCWMLSLHVAAATELLLLAVVDAVGERC